LPVTAPKAPGTVETTGFTTKPLSVLLGVRLTTVAPTVEMR
jgi:hypothetical protein